MACRHNDSPLPFRITEVLARSRAHGLAPGAIKEVIAELRSLTDKPFAMNLWVSTEDENAKVSDEAAFRQSLKTIAPLIESMGGELPPYQPYSAMKFEEQVQVLIDANVPAFSFIYGIPPKEILDECRTKGIVLIGTATTVDEAIALQKANVDIIVASGFEAGGHRGSFLRSSEDSLTGTFSLVPQVADVAFSACRRGGRHCRRAPESVPHSHWRRRRADRNGLSRVRGVWCDFATSPSLAERQRGQDDVDSRLYGEARAGHQEQVNGDDECARRGNPAISAPTFADAKCLGLGRKIEPSGTHSDVGRAECEPWRHTKATELLDTLVANVSAMFGETFAVESKRLAELNGNLHTYLNEYRAGRPRSSNVVRRTPRRTLQQGIYAYARTTLSICRVSALCRRRIPNSSTKGTKI